MHAAAAQHHAEALQRAHIAQQHQQPLDPEKLISGLPESAQTWLRAHPEFVTDPAQNAQLQVAHNYLLARRGVQQFSPEYFDALNAEFGFAPPRSERPDAPSSEMTEPAMSAPPPPPAPPPVKRSMPLSAPVQRDVPSLNGQRASERSITLTAEERMIARNSFTDPSLSDHEKEMLYAKNKAKYQAQLADGSYTDARHQR
jgi:hypothetical protein